MSAPNTNPTPEKRLIGPFIGAGAVVVFLLICLFAYLTFEPDPVEDDAPAAETATDADTE